MESAAARSFQIRNNGNETLFNIILDILKRILDIVEELNFSKYEKEFYSKNSRFIRRFFEIRNLYPEPGEILRRMQNENLLSPRLADPTFREKHVKLVGTAMVRICSIIVRYAKDSIKNEKKLFICSNSINKTHFINKICSRSIKKYLGKSNMELFTIEEGYFLPYCVT